MGKHRPHIKVRGGKRHLQRLERESTVPKFLDIQTLTQYHYYYEKLGLAPWYRRKTPKLIRQLAVQHLLTTFFAWQFQLATLPEPCYLGIWIVAPEFSHSSQVVAAVQERIEWYQANFNKPDPTGPALPAEYLALPGADKLTWHPLPWEVLLDAVDYPNGWPAWALRKPNHILHSADGSEFLVVQTGWMWLGMMADIPG